MSERKPLTFQEFKDYLGNGCVEALDYGLCSDDLGPDVPGHGQRHLGRPPSLMGLP